MKKKLTLLLSLLLLLAFTSNIVATNIFIRKEIVKTNVLAKDSFKINIEDLTINHFEKLLGRSLKFKEKAAIKFLHLQLKLSNKQSLGITNDEIKIEKQALWSKWLGIGSLIGLFIPGITLLSLPAAIIAIVLGAKTLKHTKNPKYSRQGIIFGSITLLLFLIAIAIIALFFIFKPIYFF